MKRHTLAIYGDSISTRFIGDGGYQTGLEQQLPDMVIYNHAIAASGLTATTPDNLVQLLDEPCNLHADSTVILVWHGTNDWYWGSKLGDVTDMVEDTFAGAVGSAVQKLRTVTPKARILYLTPLYRRQAADGCTKVGEAWTTKNRLGHTLRDYSEMIERQSQQLCFEVLDIRRLTGFCSEAESEYQPDGIHPSACGCDIVAKIIAKAIIGGGNYV